MNMGAKNIVKHKIKVKPKYLHKKDLIIFLLHVVIFCF